MRSRSEMSAMGRRLVVVTGAGQRANDRNRRGPGTARGYGATVSGLRRVCVFCGSSSGTRRDYEDAAVGLGRLLVERDIGLVYGGAAVGLMGALADAVLSGGGEAIGVIPEALVAKEIAHEGLTELRVVASMHERKAVMADLADAFVALPGGYGTFEETFEVVTWTQLGLHDKAVGLLD